jgi:hypothetical protein
MCAVAVLAYAMMLSTYANRPAEPGQVFPADVPLILLPPTAAYCLAGILARREAVVSASMLGGVVALSAVTVAVHLGSHPLGLTVGDVWVLQWGAGAAAILAAIATGWDLFSVVGFVAGGVLGFFLLDFFGQPGVLVADLLLQAVRCIVSIVAGIAGGVIGARMSKWGTRVGGTP